MQSSFRQQVQTLLPLLLQWQPPLDQLQALVLARWLPIRRSGLQATSASLLHLTPHSSSNSSAGRSLCQLDCLQLHHTADRSPATRHGYRAGSLRRSHRHNR